MYKLFVLLFLSDIWLAPGLELILAFFTTFNICVKVFHFPVCVCVCVRARVNIKSSFPFPKLPNDIK